MKTKIITESDQKHYSMQKMLAMEGFVHCGTIYVREDKDPRMAFEKV